MSLTLRYLYDESRSPVGFGLKYPTETGWTNYYFAKNLQGDVTALYRSDASGGSYTGTLVAKYAYDPYGQVLSVTNATGTAISPTAANVANYNPFRYRGYYYDTESGFYYLQSRYYDPEICRFINADSHAATGQGFIGHNMFAYCGNDPINREDTQGEFWNIIGGALVGALVGGIVKVVSNAVEGKKLTDGLGTAMVAGAVSGGLAASGIGLVGQVVGNAAISMASNATDQVARNGGFQNFDAGDMLIDGAIGAGVGLIGGHGAGSKNVTNLGKQTVKRTMDALTHQGVSTATKEFGKAIAYFGKNAKHMVKPLIKSFIRTGTASLAGSAIKIFALK